MTKVELTEQEEKDRFANEGGNPSVVDLEEEIELIHIIKFTNSDNNTCMVLPCKNEAAALRAAGGIMDASVRTYFKTEAWVEKFNELIAIKDYKDAIKHFNTECNHKDSPHHRKIEVYTHPLVK